jgi:type IV pilus assembly protein PilC
MAIYSYRAKNLKGKEEEGTLNALDPSQLAKLLRKKGYFLVSFKLLGEEEEKDGKGKFKLKINFLNKIKKVSLSDKLFFTRNLRIMLKTGVPLPKAFKILSNQTKNSKFKKILDEIYEKITKGEKLSESLSFFPDVFPELYSETIKVGEESGNLEDSLAILIIQLKREHELKSSVIRAMIYPAIVLAMTALIGVFMMVFAIPNIKKTFEELDVTLPLTTRLTLSFADFLIERWFLLIFFLAGLLILYLFVSKTEPFKKFKSSVGLKLPLISKIARKINSALILRTLSSLLKSGVPIVHSLEVTSSSIGNFYFRKSLVEASTLVQKGEKLSSVLKRYEDLYSPMVLGMIEIGEETGETGEVLRGLADFYEEEVNNDLENLSSTIEPILIIFIGVIVGFFAVSVMQPMFSILSSI